MTATPAPDRQPPTDLVRSVSRALRVLEVVGDSGGPVSAKAVAHRCGLNLSTTYHLLRTLCYEGYLARDEHGDYRLGLEIADRFRDLVSALDTPEAARTTLRTLAAATGHSAYLARFVDGRVAICHVVEAPGSPHLEDLVVGFDEAAHATALGKALLSTLPPRRRRDYLDEQGMRPFTASTLVEVDAFEADLAAQTKRSVYHESRQYRDGVACIAAVVEHPEGDDPWAVALSATPRRLRSGVAQLTRRLRSAAAHVGAHREASG